MSKHTSDLAQLGADILQSFNTKTGHWTAAVTPHGQLDTRDVPALCQLADDLAQLHHSWTAFSALEDKFYHGFFPITAAPLATETMTNAPEQAPFPPPSVVDHLVNLPFAAGSSHSFFENRQPTPDFDTSDSTAPKHSTQSPRNEPAPKVNSAAPDNTILGQQETTRSMPMLETNTPAIGHIEQQVEIQRAHPAANRKEPFYLDPTVATESQSKQEPLPAVTAPGNLASAQLVTPASKGNASEAIWQRPLQNLGDFASGFHQYAYRTIPQIPDLPQQTADETAVKQTNNSTNDNPGTRIEQENHLPQSAFLVDQKIQETAPTAHLSLPERPIREEPAVSTIVSRDSNPAFEVSTEAEAVLEALRRQLVRDFKRYYPD